MSAQIYPTSPISPGGNSEDPWNLIPWDPSRNGAGNSGMFLRSPTPLKKQRSGVACDLCRTRKAKCTGTRPSCARCEASGVVCQYSAEPKRKAGDPASSSSGHSRTASSASSSSATLPDRVSSPRPVAAMQQYPYAPAPQYAAMGYPGQQQHPADGGYVAAGYPHRTATGGMYYPSTDSELARALVPDYAQGCPQYAQYAPQAQYYGQQ